ncbi:MAG: 50S ribosomal protein L32 [Candidatus Omnitrophica bacterium]|nr:50S ribosomal protein L32 [Candidatus Omnitrophota bacterium]
MPNPKRRHSKQRGRLRRTFYKVKKKSLSKCSQCGKPKLPHRICAFCGYYKGESRVRILSVKEKKKEREKAQQKRQK